MALENFVAMEVAKHAEWAGAEARLFHDRREREKIDLLLEDRAGAVVAIEVRSSRRPRCRLATGGPWPSSATPSARGSAAVASSTPVRTPCRSATASSRSRSARSGPERLAVGGLDGAGASKSSTASIR